MLKSSLLVVSLVSCAVVPSLAMAASQAIDSAKSELAWTGKKVLVSSSHNGVIKVKSGSVDTAGDKLTGIKVVADMTTIECKDLSGDSKGKLERHLKNDDFFSVNKFPTASFTSTEVKPVSGKAGQYLVKGNLTIKDKTHPISFTATTKTSPYRHLVADFSFDRTKYDVRYSSGKFFANLGDKVIADAIGMKTKLAY